MANVSCKIEVKYTVTQKSGHKEISQKHVNQELFFPEITEAQFKDLLDYVESVSAVTDLIGV